MPTDKSRYHRNFNKRSDKVTEQPCRICGARSGEWCITTKVQLYKVVIQAHHPNHDPWNGRAKLIPLCEQCHLKIDKWYVGKKISYTLKGKRYAKLAETGQQTIPLKHPSKGRKIDLAGLILVDHEWMAEKLIAHLKAELNKPKSAKSKLEAEQLSMFPEDEENPYPVIEVDFPVSQFLLSPSQSAEISSIQRTH